MKITVIRHTAGGLTSAAARERPDSFADLVYSLQQAASAAAQMGAHTSKDLRGAAAATTVSPQQQGQAHHRHKKSTRVKPVPLVC